MKRTQKILSLVLAAAMLTSLLTACSSTASSSASTQSAATTAEQSAAEETAAATAAPELEGTININMPAGPGAKEAWDAVAKGYMAIHPKVNVVVDLKPAEGYADWAKNMYGNASPTADLLSINLAGPSAVGKSINFMEYANTDSPYAGADNTPWTDQFNFEMQVKDLARNEWTMLSLESVQVLWCYNKDIFAEVGVEPPTTWNEMVSVCEKIEAAGYQPLAVAGDFNSFYAMQMGWLAQIYADQTTRTMLETYRAKDGDYNFDPDMDGTFTLDINDPFNDDPWKVNQNPVRAFKAIQDGVYKPDSDGMKTVYENFKMLFPKYAGGDAFFGTKDATPLFYQGKAAMFLDGAWRLAMFKNDMDKMASGGEVMSGEETIDGVKKFELGTFNMPSMEGAGIEAKARTIEVALGFVGAVKKDKAHDDLVVDFLMYYSSAAGYSQYMSEGLDAGLAPAGPPLVYGVELPDAYASLFSNLSFIGNCQKGYGQMIARGAPGDVQESLRDWYNYTQEFLSGNMDVTQWAEAHKANVLKYFEDGLAATKINITDLENPQNAPTGK